MEIRPVDSNSVGDLGKLFGTDKSAAGCWCMWFIIPVKDYHAAGGSGNEASFRRLLAASDRPMGVIGYDDDQPTGWCAAGPRSRYARGIKTPTYGVRDTSEDDSVWLIPCLFVRKDRRQTGLSDLLVNAAVGLAKENGATAVEAFPLSGTERRSKDTQVGFESAFSRCGFVPIGRPSSSRVMMRLELSPDRP
jgi:GNAT superfamily N-acetyltransferase